MAGTPLVGSRNSPQSVLKTIFNSPQSEDERILKKLQLTPTKMHGKHAKVYVVNRRNSNNGNEEVLAVKQQRVMTPKDKNDRAYRELRIYQALSRLEIPNFIHILDHAKAVHNQFSQSSPDAGGGGGGLILHFILEYADKTFDTLPSISIQSYREIVFQILFALYRAQQEYEFIHGDLHLKNIMLQSNRGGPIRYVSGDKEWYIQGDIVKILDFGLSRLRLRQNGVLVEEISNANPLNTLDPQADVRTLASYLPQLSRKVDWTPDPQAKMQARKVCWLSLPSRSSPVRSHSD
jgi:serine/threonine protein kinase